MDSRTGSWNHGHAAIGYDLGTIEIRGPSETVKVYTESRIRDWYKAKTGGFYTIKGVGRKQNNDATKKALDFKGRKYKTKDLINGMTCVDVVNQAWKQGGKIDLKAVTPSDLSSSSKTILQFKWIDVRYD